MIKLQIYPAQLNICDFEIKKAGSRFRLMIVKSSYFPHQDKGASWYQEIEDSAELRSIFDLIEQCSGNTNLGQYKTISGGVRVKCSYEAEETVFQFEMAEFEDGSKELALMQKLIRMTSAHINDGDFQAYLELLQGYFFSEIPVKEFAEDPYRLRIYGRLTVRDAEALKAIMEKLARKDRLCIDMRNFQGMGTAVYPAFLPLFEVEDLEFLTNKNAKLELIKMGFL